MEPVSAVVVTCRGSALQGGERDERRIVSPRPRALLEGADRQRNVSCQQGTDSRRE
jgi:hypothetical protein